MKKYVLRKITPGKTHIKKRIANSYLCGRSCYDLVDITILPGTSAKLNGLLSSSEICKRCKAKIEKIGMPTELILVR